MPSALNLRRRLRDLVAPRAPTPVAAAVQAVAPEPLAAPPSVAPRPVARPAARRRAAPSFRQALQERATDALAQRFDALYNGLSGLGGANDKGSSALPDTTRQPLALPYLDALYLFSAYGRRVVDLIPNDATRKGWREVDSTEKTDVLADEKLRLHMVEKLALVWKWARHAGGAGIYIVVDETPDPNATAKGDSLRLPLDPARVKRIRNLVLLDRNELTPMEYEGELGNERFGEPRTWSISPGTAGTLTDDGRGFAGGTVVHHTRVLYFGGRELPRRLRQQNGGHDHSVLEACWDAIRGMESIDDAARNIAQELKLNIMRIPDLKGLQTGDMSTAFALRMQQIAVSKSLLNMVMLGGEETFESLSSPMVGFEHLDANAKAALACAADMPQTKLFGEAPGGLTTDNESGERNWNNHVASEQATKLRRPVEYLTLLMYAQTEGPTGGQVPDSWSIEFNPLDELSETEEAANRKTVAETDAIYVVNGILPPDHVARSRFGEEGWKADMLPYDPDAVEADEEAASGAAHDLIAQAEAVRAEAAEMLAHTDSAGQAWISIPMVGAGLVAWEAARGAVEAITGPLEVSDTPHLTVLFLGDTAPEALGAIVAAADDAFAGAPPLVLRGVGVRTFAGSAEDPRIPVYLDVVGAWPLVDANTTLLRRLAHLVTAPQHPAFVPHLTLGYARTLSLEQRAALAELAAPVLEWTSARAEVRYGDIPIKLIPLDARSDDDE